MPKTKILYLITSLNTLGPARALVNIAIGLSPDKFDVVFCHCDDKSEGKYQQILKNKSIPTYALNTRGPLDLRVLYRLVKILKKERVDILHSRLSRADFYARLAGTYAGVPFIVNNLCDIYTEHFKTWHNPLMGQIFYRVDRLSLGLADRFVANSDGVRNDLIENVGVPRTKVDRIYNGINFELFHQNQAVRESTRKNLGIGEETRVVGMVANLVRKKGISYLLESAKQVTEQLEDVLFLIVGDGPERPVLEKQKTALGLREKVRFLGARRDVPELLSGMDIFAFPSFFEGHPNAVLEAMAAGLSVVATDIPGTNEVVRHGETGYLVPVRDSSAMAERLIELMRDKEKSRAFGVAGRELISTSFGIDEMVRQYEHFYGTCRNTHNV